MMYIPMLLITKIFYAAMLVLSPFAVYRVATMVALEEGPFSIFEKFRNLFLQPNWIGRGVRCPSCISFWVGLVTTLAMMLFGTSVIVQFVIVWFGLSGMAVYLAMRKF